MFGATTHTTPFRVEHIEKRKDEATYKNFGHAGASIRKDAIASVERGEGPSEPGTPPHTRRKNAMRRAILYAADKYGAVIGPAFSKFGTAGQAHEHGGEYKGQVFPQRPTMFPAMVRGNERFAGSWDGAIGD